MAVPRPTLSLEILSAMTRSAPTRDAADQYLEDDRKRNAATFDANDFLYAVSASRNYDPSSQLEKITAPVMWINSADDFINRPSLESPSSRSSS